MTNLEKLTNKIKELNPEIMELKFGCEFIWSNENYEEEKYKIINVFGIDDIQRGETFEIQAVKCSDVIKTLYSFDGYDEENGQSFAENVVKILGRDINIEDVLIALEIHLKNYGEVGRSQTFIRARIIELLDLWVKGKPLHLQSEETINFLTKIFNL